MIYSFLKLVIITKVLPSSNVLRLLDLFHLVLPFGTHLFMSITYMNSTRFSLDPGNLSLGTGQCPCLY